MMLRKMIFKLMPGMEGVRASYECMGLREGEAVLMLGEIENMPGHFAVVTGNGRVLWGMHDENFVEEKDFH